MASLQSPYNIMLAIPYELTIKPDVFFSNVMFPPWFQDPEGQESLFPFFYIFLNPPPQYGLTHIAKLNIQ